MRRAANDHSTNIEVSNGKADQSSWFIQMFDHIVRVHKVKLSEFQCLGVVIAGGLNNGKGRKIAASPLNLRRDRLESDIANAVLDQSGAKSALSRSNFQNRSRPELQDNGVHPFADLGRILFSMVGEIWRPINNCVLVISHISVEISYSRVPLIVTQ